MGLPVPHLINSPSRPGRQKKKNPSTLNTAHKSVPGLPARGNVPTAISSRRPVSRRNGLRDRSMSPGTLLGTVRCPHDRSMEPRPMSPETIHGTVPCPQRPVHEIVPPSQYRSSSEPFHVPRNRRPNRVPCSQDRFSEPSLGSGNKFAGRHRRARFPHFLDAPRFFFSHEPNIVATSPARSRAGAVLRHEHEQNVR